jgi:pimeloyl-ACP methyl ester carboxylesterase
VEYGVQADLPATLQPVSREMHTGATITYTYQQKRYVYSRQGPGSLVYVPRALSIAPSETPVPIVVFLHGLNPEERLHPEFDHSALDPRRVVDELIAAGSTAAFLLAAPTHARIATGIRSMWHDFELDAFLTETQRALGSSLRIDRTRVILAGHSGGGCNPSAGLLGEYSGVLARLAIDTCLDGITMPRLTALSSQAPLHFFYQTQWERPFAEFAQVCQRGLGCEMHPVEGLRTNPHREIIGAALRSILPVLLPKPLRQSAARAP